MNHKNNKRLINHKACWLYKTIQMVYWQFLTLEPWKSTAFSMLPLSSFSPPHDVHPPADDSPASTSTSSHSHRRFLSATWPLSWVESRMGDTTQTLWVQKHETFLSPGIAVRTSTLTATFVQRSVLRNAVFLCKQVPCLMKRHSMPFYGAAGSGVPSVPPRLCLSPSRVTKKLEKAKTDYVAGSSGLIWRLQTRELQMSITA